MQPGDLIRLSNKGTPVRVVPDVEFHSHPSSMKTDYPSGTLAVVLEAFIGDKRDGPSMESYAKVMVEDLVGFVWLYECEVVNEAR
jgi:hypothetical protein